MALRSIIIFIVNLIITNLHKCQNNTYSFEDNNYFKHCVLLESVFGSERPGTVFFNYNHFRINMTKNTKDNKRFNPKGVINLNKHKEFMLTYTGFNTTAPLLKEILRLAGFVRIYEHGDENSAFILFYKNVRKKMLKPFNKYQRYGHIPYLSKLNAKDEMWKHYKKMRERFPEDYNFIRDTYLIPEDWDKFNETFDTYKEKVWMMKPKNSYAGKGIQLIESRDEVTKKTLITEYITNPFLLFNRKFDIRIFTVVTSVDPLRIYVYQESYVSFAAEEFSLDKSLYKNKTVHLTQFSIGKSSSKFDISMSKITLSQLKSILAEQGVDFDKVWDKLKDAVVKVIMTNIDQAMAEVPKINKNKNTFYELYAFDTTFDANLNPWIFEMNIVPDLNPFLEADKLVKNMMLSDMLTLIGHVPYSHSPSKHEEPELIHDIIHGRNSDNIDCSKNTESETCFVSDSLSDERREQLMYCIDEFSRQGGFQRVFPVKETLDYYSKFIKNPGPDNELLWKWISNPDIIENELNIKRIHGPEYDV